MRPCDWNICINPLCLLGCVERKADQRRAERLAEIAANARSDEERAALRERMTRSATR